MTAEIISIGTELLLGHIVNTNTSFLSQKLAEIGVDVYHTSVVGDNPMRLTQAIKQAVHRSDVVITTGGLGPTVDDITIETIAALVGKRLILNKTVLKDLKDYFKMRKTAFPRNNVRQAMIPEDTKWIRNRAGTAPGLIADYRGKIIVCLPGPPREIEPMFVNDIMPLLIKRSAPNWIIKSRTIKIASGLESLVNNKVKDLLNLKPPTTVGIYAKLGQVELKIMSKAKTGKEAARAIALIEQKIRSRLKDHIFGCDHETLEGAVAGLLIAKKKTIAAAESCTGGLLSSRLTDVSGSSKYFIMGLIAYSNEVKKNILCVDSEILKKYGAVSAQVASQMAVGIKLLAGADIGVGITGIAGPTGGTRTKPVGLVYIALAIGSKLIARELKFRGSREEIKFQSSQVALDLIRLNV
ncbi:MAG: competence/damage-inducible protein A [Candidatus Omnitrophota bacterium]|jgi:nicotinamide-nucleotide amidase